MKKNYVKEMVLVPKQQMGGQSVPPVVPDTRQQPPVVVSNAEKPLPPLYWQRQQVLSDLHSAPVVDEAIRILRDMRTKIGKPTQWPGRGSSEYFRLQKQLQSTLPPSRSSQNPQRQQQQRQPPVVGTWQPHHEPVFTTIGDTTVATKYPDGGYLTPPTDTTEASISQAYDTAWKYLPFYNDRRLPLKLHAMKSEALRTAERYNKADTEEGRAKAKAHLDRQWHAFQTFIYQTTSDLKNQKQRGTGRHVLYKKPRGWLQE